MIIKVPTKHGVTQTSNTSQPPMLDFCAHCYYKSDDKWCVGWHQSRKHKTPNKEGVKRPLPMQSEEQPIDWDLVEDIIEVF